MAASEHGDAIRKTMTTQGMTEDDLIEGCRQIVEEHEKAQAAVAVEQERQHTAALKDELARQAQSSGDPRRDLMDNLIRNMTKG